MLTSPPPRTLKGKQHVKKLFERDRGYSNGATAQIALRSQETRQEKNTQHKRGETFADARYQINEEPKSRNIGQTRRPARAPRLFQGGSRGSWGVVNGHTPKGNQKWLNGDPPLRANTDSPPPPVQVSARHAQRAQSIKGFLHKDSSSNKKGTVARPRLTL